MEAFELVLVVLACVIASAVVDQAVSRVSLPLIQIAVGFVAALILPSAAEAQVEPELFLVLFIAPLLFNEARHADKRALWDNKGSILSLAIGLVLALVLVIGFTLNLLVPSIPLAAAFACAAALGPTDAAAVAALGSTVRLSERQETLLSGESLINDASGVVAFQFAIAAALTGAFSAIEAGASFMVLFFGGIAAGAAGGLLLKLGMGVVRRRGFESTTVHVIYEVFTPFVVFLAAEAVGASGIIAVVAAGLVMTGSQAGLSSTSAARHRLVSNSVWDVIVFLINGIIFVMLGMQLPQAMSPTLRGAGFTTAQLVGLVLLLTAILVLVRFVWVACMDLLHKDPETGRRGYENRRAALMDALVTTLAGPKGAVTLSIIFTIPYLMPDGTRFPMRNLIIFLTAGVILCTLLAADVSLPLLARKPDDGGDRQQRLRDARIELYGRVVDELKAKMKEGRHPEYQPATRLTIARYRTRANRERLNDAETGQTLAALVEEVLEVQQKRADEIQAQGAGSYGADAAAPYYIALQGIRRSVGYVDGAETVGVRLHSVADRIAMAWKRLVNRGEVGGAGSERVYRESCEFAIELEDAAIEYLKGVRAEGDEARAKAAAVLLGEHRAARASIKSRLDYSRPSSAGADDAPTFSDQFAAAWRYANEVDSAALEIELDQIRKMHQEGAVDEYVARKLREDVYLLQMNMSA